MDREDIQKHIDKIIIEQNNTGLAKFEGYSPAEMYQIINFTFSPSSIIQFKKLNDADFKMIPIFNQIKYLVDLIIKNGELKLTSKGFLPPKVVIDIYNQGFIKEEYIESGICKLTREVDSKTINLTRILLELSSLVKKRNGKLSMTKSSEKIQKDNYELLKLIFIIFTARFNWAYYDGYENEKIGQLGFAYSLILLSKYGKTKQTDSFYADKYFNAFPQLLEPIAPRYSTNKSSNSSCYSLRTFERFLDYFGLVQIEEVGSMMDSINYITTTALFDKLIKCAPPQTKVSK